MRELPPQREIVVPCDMRGSRAAKAAPRRASASSRSAAAPSEFRAACSAVAGWVGHMCVQRPGETAGSVVAFGAAVYVSLNALGFQAGRHPAPILPQPKTEMVEAKHQVRPNPIKAVEPAPRDKPEVAPLPAQAASRDAIGSLIRSAEETTASVTPKPEKSVMQAQRALSKLGYGPLKDDGVMGPGTRAALEKFERDRKLPVKGEASGRTLRELATRAGAAKG